MGADYSAENTAAAKGDQQMKAVITVIGQDKIGIIYNVTSVLAEYDVNVLDINEHLGYNGCITLEKVHYMR